jgi:predicted ferric reductase
MHRVKIAWAGVLASLAALWLATAMPLPPAPDVFALRDLAITASGVIAIGVMGVCLVLATRPMWLEPWIGGLDKMYRLHKWLGVTALVVAVAHWLFTQSAGWAVGLGWLVRPARVRPAAPDSPVLLLLGRLREAAEGVGEWAFYAAVLLIALALFKRFPYRLFFKTHRLIALAWVALVFHTVVLFPPGYWPSALGPVLALLLAGGSVAAAVVLLRRVGTSRRVVGVVNAVTHHGAAGVLEVAIRFTGRWPGHRAGQFAFATFDAAEGAHPFTISSAWMGDGRALLLIRNLGDYTARLPASLEAGDAVTLEGPYGAFDFAGAETRQIWVAGGIGITPFIARMGELAAAPDGKPVALFYSTGALEAQAGSRLAVLARNAGVTLHVLQDSMGERLDAARVRRMVPDWRAAGLWFCGPAGFGSDLRRQFRVAGMAAANFHQELFELR